MTMRSGTDSLSEPRQDAERILRHLDLARVLAEHSEHIQLGLVLEMAQVQLAEDILGGDPAPLPASGG